MTPLAAVTRYAIIAGGINDVAEGHWTVPAIEANIVVLRNLAIADGMIPIVATITPGSLDGPKEANRQALNEWIRSNFAFIDFTAIVADPDHPDALRPAWFGTGTAPEIHYGAPAKEAIGQAVASWVRSQ
jgi:hypothetical protein